MTSAEFAAWIVRSLVLAFASVLAQRAWPAGRTSRAVFPLLAFAGLLALTAHDCFHGPQIPVAAPPALADWPSRQAFAGVPGRWLAAIWLGGVAFLLFREVAAVWRLRAHIRASSSLVDAAWQGALRECCAQLRLTSPVELRLSGRLGPAATGLRHRLILLPPACLGWTSSQRRFILLHELAHFRHGDLAARLFARAACAVQWFNPFAWQLARRMNFDREAACDAAVVAETAAPDAYAETLLAFAEAPAYTSSLPAFAFSSSRRSTLEARILRLLSPAIAHSAWRRWCGTLLALVVLTIAGVLCACSLQPSAAPVDDVRLRLTADPFPGER